jgi:Protein of unknown function (DUF2938)
MIVDPLAATVLVGLGATFVMDLWTMILNRAFAVPLPNYCFVGRWLRHMVKGTFTHPSIAAAPQQPAECPIGWIAHYTVGILFAVAFVAFATPQWLKSPSFLPALIFGVVTVAVPYFIMQPAFGLGLAAAKAPNPMQARLRSLMNHVVFGIGLYLSAVALSSIAVHA